MSKAQIVRKSFNGGEITPELHYRSDLETYHNACKSLKNMTVTPWGAATRRPPTELLAKIDTATYGVPVKYLPFRFSLTETFHIIFTDGSGSASSDSDTADFIVFDADGVLQTLEGASTKILTTVYDPADLGALHHIQVNDFIYMTCGGDYPVQALSRFFNEVEDANRWKVEEWEFVGGPKEVDNFDETKVLSLKLRGYDAAKTYSKNEVVVETNSNTLFADSITALHYWGIGGGNRKLWVEVTLAAYNAVEVGSVINLLGIGNKAGSNSNGYFPSVQHHGFARVTEKAPNSGQYLLLTDYVFQFPIGATQYFTVPTYTVGDPDFEVVESSSGAVAYKSREAENLGNDLGNSIKWEEKSSYMGELDVYSGFDFFKNEMIGSLIGLRDINFDSLTGTWQSNNLQSISFPCFGRVQLVTEGGAWSGKLRLLESKDEGSTWVEIGFIASSGGASNGSIERSTSGITSLLKVELVEYVQQSGFTLNACAWRLSILDPQYRFLRIKSVLDSRNAIADTQNPVRLEVSTYKWARGVFAEDSGYPNTLTIHDERMVFGGTKRKPNTVWASRVNDWTNFLEGDTDVSPYTFTIKSDSFDTIRWMRSTRNLMIGTENSETTMGTRDDSAVISPTNIDVRTQTYFGSANIQAVVTADLVFFVQGQRRRVRSTQYDFGTDQYLSSEMSILAHHITKPGIKEMSFRRHPYSSIFFVLEDGRAVSFTYERDNQVKGWARMEFGGDGFIISAASNYSDVGDIIGGIVKRGSEYTLETFGSFDSGTVYLDGQTQSDSGWSSGKALDYADTSGLAVVMDDVLLVEGTDYTWSGFTLTIPGHTDETVTVGWPFAFEIEPTDIIELGDHGAQKRISKLGLYLLASGGCDIAVNGEDCPFQEGDGLAAGSRLNGEHQISVGGGTESAIRVKLSGDHHKPFNISAFGVFGQPSR